MSKVLAPIAWTADVHCHEHPLFATYNDDTAGVNSRLMATVNAFLDIARKAKSRGATAIFIAGDWNHSQESLTLSVLDIASATLLQVRHEIGLDVFAIPGNHDMSQDSRYCSITSMPFTDVFTEMGSVVSVLGWRIGIIPWTDDASVVKNAYKRIGSCDVVAAHLGVSGATKGPSDLEIPGGIASAALGRQLTFAGHYHKPQEVPGKNFYYVGSPLQISRGEAGEDKSFVLLRPGGKWSRVPLPDSPKFLRLRPEELKLARPCDYVDLIVDDPTQATRLRADAALRCKASIQTVLSKPLPSAPVRLPISSSKIKEQLKLWVNANPPPASCSDKQAVRAGLSLLSSTGS